MNAVSALLQSAMSSGFSGFRKVGSGVDSVAYANGNDIVLVQSCRAWDSAESAAMKRLAIQSSGLLLGYAEDDSRAYIHTTATDEFLHEYSYSFSTCKSLVQSALANAQPLTHVSERCASYALVAYWFPRRSLIADIPSRIAALAEIPLFAEAIAALPSFCKIMDTLGAIGDYASRKGISEAWLDNGDWNFRVADDETLYLADPVVVGNEFRYHGSGAALSANMSGNGSYGYSSQTAISSSTTPSRKLSEVSKVDNRLFIAALDYAIAHDRLAVVESVVSMLGVRLGAQTASEFARYIEAISLARTVAEKLAIWKLACNRFAGFVCAPRIFRSYFPREFRINW